MEVVNGDAEDPLVRLGRFRAEHPEVDITAPGPYTGAFWIAVDAGQEVASGYWLKQLMEKLERKYP